MTRRRGLAVFLLLALFAIARAGDLDFVNENIFVSIHPPDTMRVKGDHFFACREGHALETTVQCPFRVDSDMTAPQSKGVASRTGSLTFDTIPGLFSILFRVSIARRETSMMSHRRAASLSGL